MSRVIRTPCSVAGGSKYASDGRRAATTDAT